MINSDTFSHGGLLAQKVLLFLGEFLLHFLNYGVLLSLPVMLLLDKFLLNILYFVLQLLNLMLEGGLDLSLCLISLSFDLFGKMFEICCDGLLVFLA